MAKRIQRQAQQSVKTTQVIVISILLSLPMIGCTGVSGFSHLPEPPSYKLEVPNCYPQIKSALEKIENNSPDRIHVFRTAIDCQEERTESYRAKMRLYKAYIEGINE